MKKIIIIFVAILLVIIIVVSYFYWSAIKKSPEPAELLQKATQGVLPSITANPMENKPDLNPVDKANPIKDIKINPFE